METLAFLLSLRHQMIKNKFSKQQENTYLWNECTLMKTSNNSFNCKSLFYKLKDRIHQLNTPLWIQYKQRFLIKLGVLSGFFFSYALANAAVDLVMTGGSVIPNKLYIGRSYTIKVDVKNIGTTSTSTSFWVSVFVNSSNSINGSQTYLTDIWVSGGLAAGATKTVTGSITIPSGYSTGTKYIIAGADGTNLVSESNEGNQNFGWSTLIKSCSLGTPTGNSPGYTSSYETISTATPTLSWTAVTGAVYYGVYIRNMSTGVLIYKYDCATSNTSFSVPSGILSNGGNYRWNCIAVDGCSIDSNDCYGGYSTPLYFSVCSALSNPTGLTTSSISSSSFTLSWSGVSGATSYDVDISTSSTFSSIYSSNSTVSNSINFTGLPCGTLFYYRVRAKNTCSTGSYSSGSVQLSNCSCSYSLSFSSWYPSSASASNSVYVSTGSGCNWTASTIYSWITVNSGTNYTSSGYCYFSISSNSSSFSRTGTIIIAGQTFTITQSGMTPTYPPNADFTADKTHIAAGSSVTFTDQSSNSPTSWEWTIAGGNPYIAYKYTIQNPFHKFTRPGAYTVTLKATNSAGSSSPKIKTAYITVTPTATYNVAANKQEAVTAKDGATIADPILLSTGAYIYKHTDIQNPAFSTEVRLRRYYNSQNASKLGVFGYGWRHMYEYTVENKGDSLWIVSYPDGGEARFIPIYNSGGLSFPLFSGIRDSLIFRGGTFHLYTPEGSVLDFKSNGKLSTITNRFKDVITIYYYPKLITIAGPVGSVAGRYFDLVLDSATGLVTKSVDINGSSNYYKYNSGKDLIAAIGKISDTTKYEYQSHRMTKAFTPEGNIIIDNTYDSDGRVYYQKDAFGNATSIAYNTPSAGYATVTFPNGTKRVYFHDSSYRNTYIKDELGRETFIYFNYQSHVDSVKNAKKQVAKLGYDANHFPNTITEPGAITTSVKYNKFGQTTSHTDANGKVTTSRFDSLGIIEEIRFADKSRYRFKSTKVQDHFGYIEYSILPNKDTVFFTHTSMGQIESVRQGKMLVEFNWNFDGTLDWVKLPSGGVYRYHYDAAYRLIKITGPMGYQIRFAYDKDDNITTLWDARGIPTYFKYNKKGKLVARHMPYGVTDSFFYDKLDRVIGYKDPEGYRVNFGLDDAGQIVKIWDSAGVVNLTYDSLGLLSKIVNQLNQSTRYKYNASTNYLESVTDPLGRSTKYALGKVGELKSTTHTNGATEYLEYSDVYQPVKITEVLGEKVYTSYDSMGHTKRIINALGYRDSFIYDKHGREVMYLDAENNAIRKVYGDAGLLKKIYTGIGSLSAQYDSLDRINQIKQSDGKTYTYWLDLNNNLLKAKLDNDSVLFSYDSLNRMVKYTDPYGKVLEFTYDKRGLRKGIKYPNGKWVYYSYDILGRLKMVLPWWTTTPFKYEYDSASNETKLTYPTGAYKLRKLDALNRVTSHKIYKKNNELIFGQELTYSDTAITEIRFDVNAGKLLKTDTIIYTYRKNNSIKSDRDRSYASDSTGATTQEILTKAKDTANYRLSITGDLTRWQRKKDSISYKYDPLGQRIAKKVNTVESRFVVMPNSLMPLHLQTTTNSGTVKASYIYGLGLLAMEDSSGNIYYYHSDMSHNVVAITNSIDTIVERYVYNPFGLVLSQTDSIDQPFKFLGELGAESENDTIYYLRARYYNALTRRFISKDPLFGDVTDPATLNRYIYGFNNPLQWFDPTGYSPYEDDVDFPNTTLSAAPKLSMLQKVDQWYSTFSEGFVQGLADGSNLKFLNPGRLTAVENGFNPYSPDYSTPGIPNKPFTAGYKIGGVSVVGSSIYYSISKVNSIIEASIPNIGNKLDFLFGKSTGSAHNISRSTSMLRQLESVGIFDNSTGRALLKLHLETVYNTVKGTAVIGGRIMRESLLMGPYGGLKVQSIWESNKLITIILLGGR